VAAGSLVVVERVTPATLIVGREFDKNGNALNGGRTQVYAHSISEEHRAKLLDQGVGFVLELGEGKFEVVELYEHAPADKPWTPPAPPSIPAPPAAAAEVEAPKAE
jgi:hypothetical protein